MSSRSISSNSEEEEVSQKIYKKEQLVELKDREELLDYCEKLQNLLRKKQKKLRRYKEKIQKLLKANKKLRHATKTKTTTRKDEQAEENAPTQELCASAAFSLVEELRQTAEQAKNLNEFVYEPTSGMYYDQKTGYYYNAEYGLYYDGNTGCYYNYNQTKNSFEFHSQVPVQPSQGTAKDTEDSVQQQHDEDTVEFDEWGGVITDTEQLHKIKQQKQQIKADKQSKYRKNKKAMKLLELEEKQQKKRSKRPTDDEQQSDADGREMEDGELSGSASCSSSNGSGDDDAEKETSKVHIFKSHGHFQDIAKKYPPSLRIIVLETDLSTLKVGNLSLITFKGGSLGREDKNDVVIPDVNVSKYHLKFNFDTKQALYKCLDLGSRNGTILNGSRMSAAKSESLAHELVHGSIIQIAQTKLLCHVHEGNSTCGQCEPGLLIETETREAAASTSSVALTHKEQLKMLQKRYGLENEKFVDAKQSLGNYKDRAATRRVQVGSSSDKEKTQQASVHTEIPSENKGFKMLSKLGWSKGEALGKASANSGLLEPINVNSNEGTKGLGCSDPAAVQLSFAEQRKIDKWKKAQQRYQKSDIFEDSD